MGGLTRIVHGEIDGAHDAIAKFLVDASYLVVSPDIAEAIQAKLRLNIQPLIELMGINVSPRRYYLHHRL